MGTLELSFHKKALWWLLLCLCFEEIACWVPSYSGPWILPKRTRDVSHGRRPSQSSSSLHESAQLPDLHGKTVYQRIFYRVHPSSSVAIPDSMVVEERVRFEPNDDASSSSSSNIRPIGPRTLILRDGNNADKTIGKAFLTLNVHEHRDGIQKHSGAGKDSTMQSTIALALFLASNPSLCSQGRLLELSSNFGLATLLGSIGAGFIAKGGVVEDDTGTVEHDILSIPSGTPWFPEKVESITLTDPDEDKLHLIVENIKSVGISANKAYVQKLDWSIRDIRPRGGNKNAAPAGPAEAMDFTCVVAGDVAYSFPETKMLARTVAHKLEPSYSYVDAYKPAPCFVHVSPDGRENSLRRLLEKGYSMSVAQGYLLIEKLTFDFQMLPSGEPESTLDKIPLELKETTEMSYISLTAEHSVDYGGEGTGEYFFPMETGQYDDGSARSTMERKWDTQ